MASQKTPTRSQGAQPTLFGFFKKVDSNTPKRSTAAPTAASPTSASPTPAPTRKATAASSNAPSVVPPMSPPPSSAGGSPSPAPSKQQHQHQQPQTSRARAAPPTRGPASPFKTPLKQKPTPAQQRPSPVSLPTPPASSPVRPVDEDEDEDDDFVPVVGRRAAANKRRNYIESGSEDNDDASDFDDDASDASDAPPRRVASSSRPPAKKARPSAPTSSTPSRPAFARASTSATSAARDSPKASPRSGPSPQPEDGKAREEFSFLKDRKDVDGNRPGDPDFDPRTVLIRNSEWDGMSNFERQYWQIKQNNMDTILMFQKGKFYEMFIDDAHIAHRELDLKLTDRGRMPMVGVPEASFEMFATKLLALGYKVGRVDQMETAIAMGMRGKKGAKPDIVHRELRHVMTTGTMIEGLEDDLANYCVALTEDIQFNEEGRETVTFGVCLLDAATSDFTIDEWVDDQARSDLETLLRSLRIKEIIHKKGELSKSTLRVIRNCTGGDCRITMLRDGKEWLSIDDTMTELSNIFADQEFPEAITSMQDKAEAMSALGGMLAYLSQLSLLNDLTSSRNFNLRDSYRSAQPMRLDANTLSHLCVLQNEDGSDAGTLHRLLNRCITPCGKRLFKHWLTHPLSEAKAIEERLDAVDELMGNIDFQAAFTKLKGLPDFERMVPKVHSGKIKPNVFTKLLQAFQDLDAHVNNLRQVGDNAQLLSDLLRNIPDVAGLAQDIADLFIVEEDGSFQPLQGADEDFDHGQELVEQVEQDLNDELHKIRKQLRLGAQKKGGCNWKHKGTNEIYQIEVPRSTKVPHDWLEISSTTKEKGYYPPNIKALVLALKEARETRLAALKAFHARLFAKFNEKGEIFMAAVRGVAQIDCLLSLAQSSYAMGEPTCRPTFVEHERALIEFEHLRHPCIAGTTDFIANDVKMGGDAAEVILLTGGNMAGKSTTARTAATAVILAQLGCRVPAKSAVISPVDRICSRMGANDQIFRNSSTFMVEMEEASRIVKECTPRSLVIMDELGRGTSTFDGHAIAHAVLHHLIARTRCLCFFLTHYLQLAYDFQGYPRCANKHMEVLVDDEQRDVVFTYRLVSGVAESSYGTQVAHLAGVQEKICDRANVISREFAETTRQSQAQRTTSTLPTSTLSDFAYLFRLGSSSGRGSETDGTTARGGRALGSGLSEEDRQKQVVSQLEVIRAQMERVASAASASASAGTKHRSGGAECGGASGRTLSTAASLPVCTDKIETVDEDKDHDADADAATPLDGDGGDEPPHAMDLSSPLSSPSPSPAPLRPSSSPTETHARARSPLLETKRASANVLSISPVARRTQSQGVFGGLARGRGRKRSVVEASAGGNGGDDKVEVEQERATPKRSKAAAQPPAPAPAPAPSKTPTAVAAPRAEQLVLDLGQRLQLTCATCAMSYDRSSPEDVSMHRRHHERVTRGVEWGARSLWREGDLVGRGEVQEGVLLRALGIGPLAKGSNSALGKGKGERWWMYPEGSSSSTNDAAPASKGRAGNKSGGGGGGAAAASSPLDFDLDALLAPRPKAKAKAASKAAYASASAGAGAGATVPLRVLRYHLGDFPLSSSSSSTSSSPFSASASASSSSSAPPQKHAVAKKLAEVLTSLDDALGAAPLPPAARDEAKLYVVVGAGRVLGAAVAGKIRPGAARRVVGRGARAGAAPTSPLTSTSTSSESEPRAPSSTSTPTAGSTEALFACSVPLPPSRTPLVGIHRIQVLPSLRRQGLASLLLGAVLDSWIYGMAAREVVRELGGGWRGNVVGFSQPTGEGRGLAEGWLGVRGGGGGGGGKEGEEGEEERGWVVFEE